ncbi:MAG: hypothetical protein ABIE74_00945 [Pseudomonadota bacterium]
MMTEIANTIEKKRFGISENLQTILYATVSFCVPFLLGHPQLIVGIVVNAALVMAALNVRSVKVIPVIIFPSLGVLSRGLIFGGFTPFLIYIIPFIWIGNAIYVTSFKFLPTNRWLLLFIGAIAKSGFLFGSAYLLVRGDVLPEIFLKAMGLYQLYTALIGGALAITLNKIIKLNSASKY